MDGIHDPGGLGEEALLKFVGGGDPVLRTHDDRGRIQIIESKLRDVGCQIAHERIAFTGVAGDDDAACFLHGFDDLFILEGDQGTGIDDLGGNAILILENISGLYGAIQCCSNGEDGDVRAAAFYVRLTQRDFVFLLGNALWVETFAHVIDPLAFQKDDRVGAVQC